MRVVRASRIVLAVFVLCFIGLMFLYVPRLANPLWSDIEFTGWVAPIAHRMAEGQRIYRDFTLPIPPGSFAVMAAFQRLTGRFYLLDELWLCALCQLLMMPIGYFLVRPFTTERNAALSTMAMVPVLIAAPKEIAYDHTALVLAWGGLAMLAQGLTRPAGRSRHRWLAGAGLLAGTTLAFKSSTGVGAVAGVTAGLTLCTTIAWRREGFEQARAWLRAWAFALAGMAGGLVLTMALVLGLGGALGEFIQIVFADGPALKGGRGQAILNLLSYTIIQTPTHLSFFTAAVLAYLIARAVVRKDALQVPTTWVDDDSTERGNAGWVFGVLMGLFVVLVFAMAGLLLAGNATRVPFVLQVGAGFGGAGSMIGLFVLVLVLAVNAFRAEAGNDRRAAFAALTLAAGVVSLIHNLSDPKHRPLYDNNPIIPLAIFSVLLLCDQARSLILKYVLVCLMLLNLFGLKFQRYLDARNVVDDPGFWAGLRVTSNGQKLLAAAVRARELAGPDGTVLMLPEDPMVEALVGRRRPPLFGAIVFVDQFPEHALDRDLAAIHANPPDVVLLHPREEVGWNAVYSIWSLKSPAARFQNDFMHKRRDELYRVDSTYPTWLFDNPSQMVLLARKRP